tara:strand:+ start:130 stop:558 length:429 start_codon:yes stop_codon:yes gene_type:complete
MSDKKKPFKETKLGKFLTNKGSKLVDVVGDILPDSGVLGVVKGLIDKDDSLPQHDKDMALELLKMDMAESEAVTKRWVADAASSKLAANVRPLTLIFFSVAYVIGWFCNYELTAITGLLQLIFGAYFGSRGFEKVMGNNRHK